ncbi:MAG: thiamine phosphate synthase [Candidatus Omnitrophota bacterium]
MPLKNKRLNDSLVYLILDKKVCGTRNLKRILKKAIQGGVDLVQYRDKYSETRTVIKEARPLLEICKLHCLPFIINDRLDVAVALGADGLHIGQGDMPVSAARKILGQDKLIGLSCHTVSQVRKAQRDNVDYLGFGPVFKTATKPKSEPLKTGALQRALKISRFPVFAIGGITEKKISQLTSGKGKIRVACIREICLAKDPKNAAQNLKKKLSRFRGSPADAGFR